MELTSMEGSHQEGHLRRGYRGTVLGVQDTEPGDGKRWCTCNSGMEGAGPQARCWGGGSRRPAAQPALSKLGGQGDEESKASARFSTSGTRRMRVPRSHSAGLQEPPYGVHAHPGGRRVPALLDRAGQLCSTAHAV